MGGLVVFDEYLLSRVSVSKRRTNNGNRFWRNRVFFLPFLRKISPIVSELRLLRAIEKIEKMTSLTQVPTNSLLPETNCDCRKFLPVEFSDTEIKKKKTHL